MYTIYHTKGIVLDGLDAGESGRYLYIFTNELGLINASAQGLRELKSKLRYSLQSFSLSNVDVVRGKSGWRVVSAQNVTDYTRMLQRENKQDCFFMIVRISSLLKRLLKGEEKNEELFDEIIRTFSLLQEQNLTREQIFNLEVIIVMRVLRSLGYWGENETFSPFLEGDIIEHKLLEKINKTKSLAVKEINKSLLETQL